jgi:site-specific recombinase XerD
MSLKRIYLPKEARAFLRTSAGRGHGRKVQVRIFHRWMDEHDLSFGHLTPAHIEHFWEEMRRRNLAPSTMHARKCHQHRYLYWLYEHGHLRFVVDPPRMLHLKGPAPEVARKFLRIRGNRRFEKEIRSFHSWLQRKKLALEDLTPQLICVYLKRPIGKPITKSARDALHDKLELYFLWLHSQGHMTFRAVRAKRKPLPTPESAAMYVDTLRPVKKSSTCGGILNGLKDFHAWLEAQRLSLDELGRPVMERWLKSMSDRELAAMTRSSRIFHVRGYLGWLFDRGMLVVDPEDFLRQSDLPKIPSYLPRPYPPEADRKLQERLAKSDDPGCRALLLMRRSGLRIGELVTLEHQCLEPDHCGNTFLKVPLGKLDNERLVPLDEKTVALAKDLQARGSSKDEFLIEPNCGRKTLKNQLRAILKTQAKGLDIPGPITSHRLRHTYATQLLNAGMSFVGIMKLLGHHSFKMTMRYAAITQETVVRDYYAALKKSEEIYAPAVRPQTARQPDPKQMLTDTISWLRKNHSATPKQKSRADAIIKRIYKIRDDINAISNQL